MRLCKTIFKSEKHHSLEIITESLGYKLGAWSLKDMGIYQAGKIKQNYAIDWHCGKCRIKLDPMLKVRISVFNLPLVSPPILWKYSGKWLECPF